MNGNGSITRLATVEARWFGDGPVPAALVDWFEAPGDVRHEEARTDRYVRLPGVEAVGVKQRAGRFEIKARRAGPTARVVWAGRTAPLERWLKWSAPPAALGDDAVPPMDVDKRRRLRALPGVQVELAALEVAGRAAWTFGLEGAGAADVEAVLASAWAAAAPVPAIAVAGGYPAWLDRLVDG
jgi:hypothetical protein